MKLELMQQKENALLSILSIEEELKTLPTLSMKELDPETTAIVFVDMVEGFVRVGPLSTPRSLAMISDIVRLNESGEFHKIYFRDSHPENCPEFQAYVPHCLNGTVETEIISELVVADNPKSHVFFKNCTNGFMAEGFQDWLKAHEEIKTFVVAGLVTDICVMTFCLTLKTYFNQHNIFSRILLPLSTTETFDFPLTHHQAELMNIFAVYNMRMNGIEVFRDFEA